MRASSAKVYNARQRCLRLIERHSEAAARRVRLCRCSPLGVRHVRLRRRGFADELTIKHGVLVPTGRYTAMKAEGSHARKTQIYQLNITDSALSEAVHA